MSFENKGSMDFTIAISREPDRSGNYICDGVADNVEHNAALAVLASLGGGAVITGRGDFNLAASVTPDDNMTWRGQGHDTHMIAGAGVTAVSIIGTGINHKTFICIEELFLDGPGSGSGNGITTDYSDHISLRKLDIRAFGDEEYSSGLSITRTTYLAVHDSRIYENGRYGAVIATNSDYAIFDGCELFSNGYAAIDCNSLGCNIVSCQINDNTTYGVIVEGSGFSTKVVGCNLFFNGTADCYILCADTIIVGNSISWSTYGIWATAQCYVSTFSANVFARHGDPNGGYAIFLDGSFDVTVASNNFNHQYSGGALTATSIRLDGASDCAIIGNTIWDVPVSGAGGYGIYLDDSIYNIIGNNQINLIDNDGIYLTNDSDENLIIGNKCRQCGGYGINISDDTCNDNRVRENDLRGNTTGPINDVGTGTMVHIVHVSFLEPIGTATWDVVAPSGIEVDAADEGAFTMGVMPPHCQQTLRIVVWAVGLAAPGVGNQMEMTFNMDAGQPDEAYNAEAITVANKDSDQTDFAVNDIVTWTFAPADDSDIGDLVAGDCFEIRAMFVAGGAPDIDTDVLFRCVEIHFV